MLLAVSKLISDDMSTAEERSSDGTCFLDVCELEELCKDKDAWRRGGILDEFCGSGALG